MEQENLKEVYLEADYNAKDIGECVYIIRTDRNLTIEDMAKEFALTYKELDTIEKGFDTDKTASFFKEMTSKYGINVKLVVTENLDLKESLTD